MRVLVFTPVWKRPEITEVYCLGLLRLMKRFDIKPFCVVSPEDPTYNKQLLDKYGFEYVEYKNQLGAKKNYGLEKAFELEWDYLMEMNSDDIVKNELMYTYLDLMAQGHDFIGLGNFAFYDSRTGESKEYSGQTVYGIARLYKRSAIEGLTLWDHTASRGMDNHSEGVLGAKGIYPYVIKTDRPLAFDIKSDVNLWSFDQMDGESYETSELFRGLSHAEQQHLFALRSH